jgi:Fe-S cluster biogenesis protein NfuA
MNISKAEVEEKLELVRPFLAEDDGNVELVDITKEGQVQIRLKGNCSNCSMKENTIKLGIENILKQFYPEISVIEVK